MNALERFNERLSPVLAKIDALSLRERALVMVTAVVVIVAIWQMVLMEPIAQRAERSQAELSGLKDRITSAHAAVQEQILQIAGESGTERKRIATLQRRIDEINVVLGNYAAELVDPAETSADRRARPPGGRRQRRSRYADRAARRSPRGPA